MTDPTTLPGMLLEQARRRPGALAIRYKKLGIWHRLTWAEYAAEVRRVGASLLAFGLARHENVAVLGENCPEWLICHLGIMAAGAATVGVYPTS